MSEEKQKRITKYQELQTKNKVINEMNKDAENFYSYKAANWAEEHIIKMYKQNPYRFVHEFLQNIDDCKYDEDSPKVSIENMNNCLAFTYNEIGFVLEDIVSLCDFGDSNKKSNQDNKTGVFYNTSTGEKGIGFKSVFGVANKVYIESNGYKFYLTKDRCIQPVWFDDINQELQLENDTLPKVQSGTRIILTNFDSGVSADKIIEHIKTKYLPSKDNILKQNILLFTKKLKALTIQGETFSLEEKQEKTFSETWDDDSVEWIDGIEDNGHRYKNVISGISAAENRITLRKYVRTIVIDLEAVKARYGQDKTQAQTRNISIIVDMNCISTGSFYTTLPLSIEMSIPLSIDAPFILNDNRTEIIEHEWNKAVAAAIFGEGGLFSYVLNDIKDDVDITKFIPKVKGKICGIDINKIFTYIPLFKVYTTLGKNIEYTSLQNGRIFKDAFGYSFPSPEKLLSCMCEDQNIKLLSNEYIVEADNKYTIKVPNECILDKSYEDCWNDYCNKTMEKDIFYSQHTVDFMKDGFYNYIEKKLEGANEEYKEKVKQLELFRYEYIEVKKAKDGTYKPTPHKAISWLESDAIWIDDFTNNKSSYGNYRTLSSSYFEKEKHPHLIALLNAKDDISALLKKEVVSIKNKEKAIELIKVIMYYEVALGEIPFLYNYVVDTDSDNWFAKSNILENFSEYEIEMIGHIANKPVKELKDDLIKFGCTTHQNWETHFDDDDKKVGLLNRFPEQLTGISAQLFIWILSKIKDVTKIKGHKNHTITLTVNEILNSNLVYTSHEQVDDEHITIDKSLWNECVRKFKSHFVFDLSIEQEQHYSSENLNEAVKWYFKNNDNQYTATKFFIACLDNPNIHFLFDNQNKVILNYDKPEEHLCSYIDQETITSKTNFKEYLKFVTDKNHLEHYKNEEPENKNKFINELCNLRKLECTVSSTDIGRLIALINDGNSNPIEYIPLELLQNINDVRSELKDKSDEVKITFTDDKMTVQYNEKGFTAKDVWSITSLVNSNKGSEQEGEKGIGFKTIFKAFSKVEIYSNGYNFYLDGDDEKWKQANKASYIVPNLIEKSNDNSGYTTTMVFYKKENIDFEKIEAIFKDKNNYLFLKNIEKISIDGKPYERSKIHSNYYIYSEICTDRTLPLEIMKKRGKWQNKTDRELLDIREKLNIEYCFPKTLEHSDKSAYPEGFIYTTLPTECELGAPFYVNAPFELTTGRNNMVDNDYNIFLKEKVFNEVFAEAIKNATCGKERFINKKNEIIYYLPSLDNKYISIETILKLKFLENQVNKELKSIEEMGTLSPIMYSLFALAGKKFGDVIKVKLQPFDEAIIKKIEDYVKELAKNQYPYSCGFDNKDYKKAVENLYNKDDVFNKDELKHKFLKENLWGHIEKSIKDNKDYFILPYRVSENETRLGKFDGNEWYYTDDKDQYSTDSYKILDTELCNVAIFKIGEINKFNKEVALSYLKNRLEGCDKYSNSYWTILREIYDLQEAHKKE